MVRRKSVSPVRSARSKGLADQVAGDLHLVVLVDVEHAVHACGLGVVDAAVPLPDTPVKLEHGARLGKVAESEQSTCRPVLVAHVAHVVVIARQHRALDGLLRPDQHRHVVDGLQQTLALRQVRGQRGREIGPLGAERGPPTAGAPGHLIPRRGQGSLDVPHGRGIVRPAGEEERTLARPAEHTGAQAVVRQVHRHRAGPGKLVVDRCRERIGMIEIASGRRFQQQPAPRFQPLPVLDDAQRPGKIQAEAQRHQKPQPAHQAGDLGVHEIGELAGRLPGHRHLVGPHRRARLAAGGRLHRIRHVQGHPAERRGAVGWTEDLDQVGSLRINAQAPVAHAMHRAVVGRVVSPGTHIRFSSSHVIRLS